MGLRLAKNARTMLTGWNGGEGVSDGWEELLAGLTELLDEGQVQPEAFSLSRQVSALLERILQQLEVWGLEQGLSGTDWVRRIGDDDIVFVLVLGQEFESIANEDGDSLVVVAFRHVGEELLRHTNDGLSISMELLFGKVPNSPRRCRKE